MLVWLDDIRLNAVVEGPEDAPPVVFVHALGRDLTLWDAVMPHLPPLRSLRFDLRGHGRSDAPPAPYTMGALIRDAERLIDHFALRGAVVVGVDVGGMVAQGLAVKRLDLVRGLVLCGTATRIATMAAGGQPLATTDPQGWMGVAAAMAGSDFYATTATLTLPTLVLAGSEDATTPPDMLRELAGLIRGSAFQLMRGAGHLPPLDQPQAFAAALTGFLRRIGHVTG